MTMAFRSALSVSALTALMLTAAAGPAQAQSAYTLTTLAKPSGSASHEPTSLDKAGTARGGMYYFVTLAFDPMNNCYFCSLYLTREVSWSSGTGATASATLGTKGFFSLYSNDKATQAGSYTLSKAPNPSLSPDYLNVDTAARDAARRVYFLASSAINRNGTVTPLASTPTLADLVPTGINSSDTLVGNGRGPGAGGVYETSGWVYRQGTLSRLPAGSYPLATASSINDQGTIAGLVKSVDGTGWRPALWVNDQIVRVGGPETADLEPVTINNADQVLLRNEPDFPQITNKAFVWFNGVLTRISDPLGRDVQATAMNDSGTVVGCVKSPPPIGGGISRADNTAFIWQNGVMRDLAQVIAAKGVQLPSGTRLGCPVAINQSGSILAFHYKPSAQDNVTWIRLNAKP